MYMYGRAGHRWSTEARSASLANHGATVSVGKFERLLQLDLLRLGDPRALFDVCFLIFSQFFLCRFFSNSLYFLL